MLKYKKGDLIKAGLNREVDIIVHGCNCFCTMGAGIAAQIKTYFPEAYAADCRTTKGDRNKLGYYSIVDIDWIPFHELSIINAYTQFTHWDKNDMLSYEAIRSCMHQIAMYNDFRLTRIGIPKIGCGLAGGDWDIVSKIIDEELGHFDVTIYTLD